MGTLAMSGSRLETLNELRTKELERSLANRESALRSIYATRSPLAASAGLAPYAHRYAAAAIQARTAEVSAAETKATEARVSEESLAKSRVDEDKAFQDRRAVEEAAYARSMAFGGYYGY